MSSKREVPKDLVAICEEIRAQSKSAKEWSDVESDDMFQAMNLVGGFDADEGAFCFSIYESEMEYWFQVTLEEVIAIASGRLTEIEIRPAE